MSSPRKWIHYGGPTLRGLFFLITSVSCTLLVSASADDPRIEGIKRISREINAQISESEKADESNGIYFNELVINKGEKSWPAVGIYRTVVKFYYTFGDREKNPYPNRLLKITVTTQRSDRREFAEYLFNPAEQLIFYYGKLNDSSANEDRLYFEANRLIRRASGERNVSVSSRSSIDAARVAMVEQKKLRFMFLNSLND